MPNWIVSVYFLMTKAHGEIKCFCHPYKSLRRKQSKCGLSSSNDVKNALLVHDLLRKLSTTAFTENGALRVKLHPGFEVVLGRAVLADADVVGGDAFDAAIFVKQNFRRGKTFKVQI
jgi:hypothetical protein